MKIGIYNHQGKCDNLYRATQRAGIENDPINPDLILMDFENKPLYRSIIEEHPNAEIMLYTHGIGSLTGWDGIFEPNPRVSMYLAQSEWERDCLLKIGYPFPVEVIGWHYCEQKPYKMVNPRNVLFAPIHPLGDGYIREDKKWANKRGFKMALETGLPVTVRTIGHPSSSGIRQYSEVEYKQGHPILWDSVEMIDQHDLIIAFGTFAHLAIARGKPTVMFGQDLEPYDHVDGILTKAKTYRSYYELFDYPFDILYPGDPGEWRDYHIGPPFDEDKFIRLLYGIYEKRLGNRVPEYGHPA